MGGRKTSKEPPLSAYSFPSPFSGSVASPSASSHEAKDRLFGVLELSAETKDRLLNVLSPSASAIPIRNSPGPKAADPTTHDKLYYDDRFNDSIFDPLLALSIIPSLSCSIGGMLLTGFFLNNIISWSVFKAVPDLFILLPVILNLRASLEQSLQSRLRAAATIGVMESSAARHKILAGNWDLVMFQSIVAGSVAGGTSCALAWLFHSGHEANLARIVLMLMVAVTASLAASSLTLVFSYTSMALSRYLGRDVTFVMGPAATAVGSSLLLVCLAGLASFFHWWISGWIGFGLACSGVVLGFGAVFFFYRRARGNEAVRSLASEGWAPLVLGLIITGVSGLLLEKFISMYKHAMVLYLPIFNGVSGNIGGFYCGEAVRNLHLFQLNAKLPRKTALTLLIFANPLHLLLVFLVSWFNLERLAGLKGLWPPSLLFLLIYVCCSNAHMLLLIALADGLIKLFWRWRMKPDAHAGNLMNATGDLAGTLLLAAVFYCMHAAGSIGKADAFSDEPGALTLIAMQEAQMLAPTES